MSLKAPHVKLSGRASLGDSLGSQTDSAERRDSPSAGNNEAQGQVRAPTASTHGQPTLYPSLQPKKGSKRRSQRRRPDAKQWPLFLECRFNWQDSY